MKKLEYELKRQDLAQTVSSSDLHPAVWRGTSRVRRTVDIGGTLLLRAIVEVITLLLMMAGDVETNPGPEGKFI